MDKRTEKKENELRKGSAPPIYMIRDLHYTKDTQPLKRELRKRKTN